MKKPSVSIILPTYNGDELIEECLNSIKKQTFKDYELIILDDCSKDNTQKILKKKGYKFIINEKNLGCTKNFNKGMSLAKGEFIFTIDQDAVYDKNCLYELMKTLKSDNKIGIAGPKCYYYKEKNKIRAITLEINLLTSKAKIVGRDQIDKGQFDNLKEINATGMGSMLIKKEVLEKVGFLPKEYIMYYTDMDFCFRVKKAGYKIVLSKAKFWHKKQENDQISETQFKNILKDKLTFMKRNSKAYPLFLIIFLFYTPLKILNKPNLLRVFLNVILNKK